MRSVTLSSLALRGSAVSLLALLAAGCTNDEEKSPDLYVVSVNPGDGLTNVPVGTQIVLRFSEAVDPTSYSGTSNQIILVDQTNAQVPITIRPTPAETPSEFVILTPATPLAQNVTYGVAVREFVRSTIGENITAPFASRFATGPILSTIPNWPPFLPPPGPPPPPGAPGTFVQTGSLVNARDTHEAGRLQNGNVLVTGGFLNAATPLRSAEVYNPTTGTWRLVSGRNNSGMNYRRVYHTQTNLDNGTVLIAGGTDLSVTHDTAEIYDPYNDSFVVVTGRMTHGRQRHQAVKIDSGNVLLIGGVDNSGIIRRTMEVYDVKAGTFTATANGMTYPCDRPSAIRQPDGRILISGGETYVAITAFGVDTVNAAAVYSPQVGGTGVSGSILPTGNRMSSTRAWHSSTLITSGPAAGLIIIIGGYSTNPYLASLRSAEVYDYQAYNNLGGFAPIAQAMFTARWDHEETLLGNQLILITGGFPTTNICPVSPISEIFDPFGNGNNVTAPYRGVDLSGRFTRTQTGTPPTITQLPVPPLFQGLAAQGSTLLLNGTVLISAGQDCFGPNPISVPFAFVYTP
ncbi:MAG: Ig-like domain-containing protein [Planctomycetales bacterium]|nr:Ig-like domain-containing protein [Planctomycetales bacterium]